jgi:hypothetical protein
VLPVAAWIGLWRVAGAAPDNQQLVANPDQIDTVLPCTMIFRRLPGCDPGRRVSRKENQKKKTSLCACFESRLFNCTPSG